MNPLQRIALMPVAAVFMAYTILVGIAGLARHLDGKSFEWADRVLYG
jgi:hypothetical protein